MIIDCHGHYTTSPKALKDYRERQLACLVQSGQDLAPDVRISDDEIRESLEQNQLRMQAQRGVDLTIFSPKAVAMDHHRGDEETNVAWARFNNALVHRACQLFPQHLVGACQLPQAPGVPPGARVFEELERCVKEYGFVAANVNPDPTGGRWSDPPLHDRRWWYPLFEKLVELDIPAMIHVSGSCNPHFDAVATHYINGDTTAFVQFLNSDILQDFPTLKFIIPHGGGAVPFHGGRYRGLALDQGLPPLDDKVLKNVFFDTCVYHQAGIDLLLRVVPTANVLFASETFGAVQGIDPRTGHHFDDTRRYVADSPSVGEEEKARVFARNALGVYPRLRLHPRCRAC